MVGKIFEKLVNRLIHPHEICSLFSDFQYGFRSSLSTADSLTVVKGLGCRATPVVTFDISKVFDMV